MEQSFQGKKASLDIDTLLHPSKAFRHPLDVVQDVDMTVAEKRSVLASWASDACAIESNPALRAAATGSVVSYDDIIDALQSLDGMRSPETVTHTFKRARGGDVGLVGKVAPADRTTATSAPAPLGGVFALRSARASAASRE